MKNGCLVLVGLVLLLWTCVAWNLPSDEQPESLAPSPKVVDVGAIFKDWTVTTRADPMTENSYPYAFVRSTNTVRLDFPYNETGLTIEVWDHPREGRQMLFQIDDGQLTCGVYDCQGQISFDGKVESLSLRKTEDHSSKYLFAAHPNALIKKMNASKKTVISLTLYRSGSPAFYFEPEPLSLDD